jgi:hypothetical protein
MAQRPVTLADIVRGHVSLQIEGFDRLLLMHLCCYSKRRLRSRSPGRSRIRLFRTSTPLFQHHDE